MHTLPSNAHLRNLEFAHAPLGPQPALALRRDALTAQLLGADLPPATERLALRLLYAAGLQTTMSWPHFLTLCRCQNQGAARRHLTRLKEAGLLAYETGAAVCIRFTGGPLAAAEGVRAVGGAPAASDPPPPPRAGEGALPHNDEPSPPSAPRALTFTHK